MSSFFKVFKEEWRLQRANIRPPDHSSRQEKRFPAPSFLRPKQQRMVARSEPSVPSREVVRSRKAPYLRSRFYTKPGTTAIDTIAIKIASPVHIFECERYHEEPNLSLDCPKVQDFLSLEDNEVAEEPQDKMWFALTPISQFWNDNATYEAKRIMAKNSFDYLLVIGICCGKLHVLNDHRPVPAQELWWLDENSLDRLLKSNDWIGIEDGLQPNRAFLAIGRVFHQGYRILHRPESTTEYQGIIVIGAYVSQYAWRLLTCIDRVILQQDVTTMLEFITNKPLRLS